MDWKYFTFKELVHSSTAQRVGIINMPYGEQMDNLNDLVTNVLDRIREDWGGPIRVTSGFRCEKLNDLVRGVKNSQHTKGQAADIQPLHFKDMDKFIDFMIQWCTHNEFDQCIVETSKTSKWIHISYNKGNNRNKMFTLNI